ncbi:MAG: PqqD family protein [Gemmatimonadales bacterium]
MPPTYLRHPDLRLTPLGDEGVALHVGARRYFTINQTGLTLLQALESPTSFEELVNRILGEYDVSREEAERTTREFVDRCLEAKLVECRE